MDLEPLYLLPADELEHLLDTVRERIENPEDGRDRLLFDLAGSVKDCLVYLFPNYKELIAEIVDIDETIHARSWGGNLYPMDEGLLALHRIYGLDLDPTMESFDSMAISVKDFARIVHHYHHERKMAESKSTIADRDRRIAEAAPLVRDGEKRRRQLHAPRDKKNKALMAYCETLMQKKRSSSANHLWGRIPEESGAVPVDGWKIYRGDNEDGVETIFCIDPAGKVKTISERRFRDYFAEIKEKLDV